MLIFGRLTWSTVLADYVVHYTVRIGLSINRPLAMATNPSSIRDPDLTTTKNRQARWSHPRVRTGSLRPLDCTFGTQVAHSCTIFR